MDLSKFFGDCLRLKARKDAMGRGRAIFAGEAAALHCLCALGLAAGYGLARRLYGITLVDDPIATLRLLLVVETPVILGVYSWVRQDPERCSFWKAFARGILGVPVGALINAFGAIVLGAPVGLKYLMETVYWSCLMSLLTVSPVACAFGLSKTDWQRILGHSLPNEVVDCMVALPAYGAVIGSWFGAWPMPLDWERPWQEWPICVTYGSVFGYLVGIVGSLVIMLISRRQAHHVKLE